MQKTNNILIRVDGSHKIGMGHLTRCMALADKLKSNYNSKVSFAMKTGELGERIINEANYNLLLFSEFEENISYEDWLIECLDITNANALILDVRDGLQPESVARIRNREILIVTIDDPEDKRLQADLAFYPPVPQVQKMNWSDFKGKLFSGWEYVILRDEFLKSYPAKEHNNLKILVTMGGSDPFNLTLQVIKTIKALPVDCDVDILLGPGFIWHNDLNEFIAQAKKPFNIHQNQESFGDFFSSHDLAIISFGVTAYELARIGIPALYLCLTNDHLESAKLFEKSNLGRIVGRYDQIDQDVFNKLILELLSDTKQRLNIRKRGPETIDGKGAERISKIIVTEFYSNEI